MYNQHNTPQTESQPHITLKPAFSDIQQEQVMNDSFSLKVGDQVKVLVGRGGDEHIEQAEVAAVYGNGCLVLHMVDHAGDCFMPVSDCYVLPICSEEGCENVAPLREYVCADCFYGSDPAASSYYKSLSEVEAFKHTLGERDSAIANPSLRTS